MKKYLKINLLIIILALFSTSTVFAVDPPTPPGGGWEDNGGDAEPGDGTQKTPIDDYLPILIITAVTIAGIYSYKQRKLIQK